MAKGFLIGCVLFLTGATIVVERIGPTSPAALQAAAPPVIPVAAGAGEAPIENFAGTVVLQRAPDSHFYAEAQVNGAQVRFLVDTGATGVVLTAADAQRAGIGAGDFSATGIGAGGPVRLKPVTLDRLALGSLTANNVPAMVAETGALPVSLLGQSWLGRLGSVAIEGERMTLR